MFALEFNPKFLAFSVKYNHKKQPNNTKRKVVQSKTYNNDSVPKTIYKYIKDFTAKGKEVNVVLKWKKEDGSFYWTITKFEPNKNNNLKNNFSLVHKFTSKKCIECTQKLYKIF